MSSLLSRNMWMSRMVNYRNILQSCLKWYFFGKICWTYIWMSRTDINLHSSGLKVILVAESEKVRTSSRSGSWTILDGMENRSKIPDKWRSSWSRTILTLSWDCECWSKRGRRGSFISSSTSFSCTQYMLLVLNKTMGAGGDIDPFIWQSTSKGLHNIFFH